MEKIFIAAGGTGGHINAAISLEEVFARDYQTTYITGDRYLDYQLFKDRKRIHLSSKPLRTKNPFVLLKNITLNIFVFIKIITVFLFNRPRFVVGAGGYVCGPTLLAAKLLLIPIFIVEQNAVMGMTNKILAKISNLIFVNFKKTKGISSLEKVRVVGNPIRGSIQPSKNELGETLKILVFGGSLGAEQINEAILSMLELNFEFPVHIVHQVGKGKLTETKPTGNNIKYEQCEYIEDMNEKYKWSNLIIARAGASTISELRVVKRPSVLIPLPIATDNHQHYNAEELKEEDLSYIHIVDNKLKENDLAAKLFEAICNIKTNSLFYMNDGATEAASTLIKKEIEDYVRH